MQSVGRFREPCNFSRRAVLLGQQLLPTMKTLPLVAFLAAFGAFLFSPLSFEVSMSLLLTLGIASILTSDYRTRAPLVARACATVARKRTALPLAV